MERKSFLPLCANVVQSSMSITKVSKMHKSGAPRRDMSLLWSCLSLARGFALWHSRSFLLGCSRRKESPSVIGRCALGPVMEPAMTSVLIRWGSGSVKDGPLQQSMATSHNSFSLGEWVQRGILSSWLKCFGGGSKAQLFLQLGFCIDKPIICHTIYVMHIVAKAILRRHKFKSGSPVSTCHGLVCEEYSS